MMSHYDRKWGERPQAWRRRLESLKNDPKTRLQLEDYDRCRTLAGSWSGSFQDDTLPGLEEAFRTARLSVEERHRLIRALAAGLDASQLRELANELVGQK